MRLIKNIIISAFVFLIVRPIALLCYDREYLSGTRFSTLHSRGWLWVTVGILKQKLCGKNRCAKWPISGDVYLINPQNIIFDKEDLNNFQSFGIYFQAVGRITIGKGTFIGPNTGLITANHDVYNLDNHMEAQNIVIGENCWIGMNVVVLPGVELGDNTVVGAGAVVTHSFKEGNCVIAGNPAKKIKQIEKKV